MVEFVRVPREITLVGEVFLDPAYDPPWPGAGMAEQAGEEPPAAFVVAWCKGCEHATQSVPCGRCGGPACANCGRCPPCDGPVNTKENHG